MKPIRIFLSALLVSAVLPGCRNRDIPPVSSEVMVMAWGERYFISADTVTSVAEEENRPIPEGFEFCQNYPNPFNSVTSIAYQLPKASDVTITVYSITGQLVDYVPVHEYKGAGSYTVQWDAGMLGSGIYFYRIEAGEFSEVRKCLLLR